MQNEKISIATAADIPYIVKLVNSAYRGEEAKQGWTHEADLIEGNMRIDESSLRELIEKTGSVILKNNDGEDLTGCVYLEKRGNSMYLGMLSVSPWIQAKGIGKKLLGAAEKHALKNGCSKIEMTVISERAELIAWYNRNGYHVTEEKKPFHSDSRFGVPRKNLEFIVMKKILSDSKQT
jgi:ribosomal protein S18 acetylase RimI-like enzyme